MCLLNQSLLGGFLNNVCLPGLKLTAPVVRFGRCWRCSLAWRLACELPVSAEVGAAYDSARVCA